MVILFLFANSGSDRGDKKESNRIYLRILVNFQAIPAMVVGTKDCLTKLRYFNASQTIRKKLADWKNLFNLSLSMDTSCFKLLTIVDLWQVLWLLYGDSVGQSWQMKLGFIRKKLGEVRRLKKSVSVSIQTNFSRLQCELTSYRLPSYSELKRLVILVSHDK